MNKKDLQKLTHGVYKIKWKSGGSSLASIGYDGTGKNWFAPCNWVNIKKSYIEDHSKEIKSIKLIKANKY